MVIVGLATRDRREHDVDARTVRQARVDHRRRIVEPAPEGGDNTIGDAADVLRVAEARARRVDHPCALVVDLARAVDHHLRDLGVVEQRLQRTQAQHLVHDFADDELALDAGYPRSDLAQYARGGVLDAQSRLVFGQPLQSCDVDVVEEPVVHLLNYIEWRRLAQGSGSEAPVGPGLGEEGHAHGLSGPASLRESPDSLTNVLRASLG